MDNMYGVLPCLNIVVEVQFKSNIDASVDLNPSNANRNLSKREKKFKSFLEKIYKQIRDDNNGFLDIVENHYTNRPTKVSEYIYGYVVKGDYTYYQFLIELRISDHSIETKDGRRQHFTKMANYWDMKNTHAPNSYKTLTDHSNAKYIAIDVNIATKWTKTSSNTNANDVHYLSYNSYMDALRDLPLDIVGILDSIPQLGVIGYKNYMLYKRNGKNEYVVYKDTNRRDVLVSGTLDDVCRYLDTMISSSQRIVSSTTTYIEQSSIDDIASKLEEDLDSCFPNYSPFRCVKCYSTRRSLLICMVDREDSGYTCEIAINSDYDYILDLFIESFQESYQFDEI